MSPAMKPITPTVALDVSARELTLIRVACLLRLDRLKQKITAGCTSRAQQRELTESYDETRALMQVGGVLHKGMLDMHALTHPHDQPQRGGEYERD